MHQPSEWKLTELLDISEVKTGKVDANHAVENGSYTFFTCALEPLMADTYSFDGELIVLPGNGANVGHVSFYQGKIEAYQRTYVLHQISILPKFVYYYLLKSWKKANEDKQFGSATNYIKMGNFKDYAVPLPSLPEQKVITEKLDTLLAQVETTKARLESTLETLKQFRQSVLAAAVSGKLTEDWRGSKTFASIKTIGSISKDIRYGTSKKCSTDIGKIPVLRIPNIGDGKVSLEDLKYADFEEKELLKLSLQSGDLLLIRSNGSVELVGKNAVISDKEKHCLFAGYLIRVRLDLRVVDSHYVSLCLRSPQLRQRIELNARSTSGVNNINSKELAALEIPLPPLEEQKEIVRRVESLFDSADATEQQVNQALERVNNLTQSILAKAFRGELTEQWRKDNPELISGDNSAEALLKKIKAEREAVKPKRKTNK
ncbi:hypothetical protein BBM16_13605 [Vibrio parahaemolyticus]|uniref:restriction endonuclease subunit S n=1 Tax=Vibrio parahaemolyticus TaxID=670 RepID=UPI00086AD926|nr:restriction endonuclease subunit S [Vibrio parahaemolyticus]EGQ7662036.1 hypothetical protein [Vibrio parahaemolyticus]ODY16094.1 hypothetical protein BBM16_13605 [Vibrio parahaemolyticus]